MNKPSCFGIWGNTDKKSFWTLLPDLFLWAKKNNLEAHITTRIKSHPKFLYGGSVDKKSIRNFKRLSELDGFLIGGASKSSKNFIDIIKNFYK